MHQLSSCKNYCSHLYLAEMHHISLNSFNVWTKISRLEITIFVIKMMVKSCLGFLFWNSPSPFRVAATQWKKICPLRLNWLGRLASISEETLIAMYISKTSFIFIIYSKKEMSSLFPFIEGWPFHSMLQTARIILSWMYELLSAIFFTHDNIWVHVRKKKTLEVINLLM